MSLALSSANAQYPAHPRTHHQHPQQQHPYALEPESNSPTLGHESLAHTNSNSNNNSASPIEPLHPSLFISTTSNTTATASHHQPQHYNQAPYYQAPSPPYSQRSNSTDLSLKPSLPFPTKSSSAATPATTASTSRHHPYTPSPPRSSHRGLSYSPPTTLPPLTLPPLSPQSPLDSSHHYPGLPASYHHSNSAASHHDQRQYPHQFSAQDHPQQQQLQRRPSSGTDDRSRSYRHDSPHSAGSPSPSPSAYNHHHHHSQQQQNGHTHESSGAASPPLSANDRRERNKAASAKYRAKKHYQSGEMKEQITVLQDQNNVLSRQLDETRTENTQLKNLVEKLKGRLVAEKVLKRLREVGRERRGGSGNGNGSSKRVAIETDSEEDDDFVGGNYDVDVDDDDDLDNVVGREDDDDEMKGRERRQLISEQKRSKQRTVERKPKSRRRPVPRSDNETDES